MIERPEYMNQLKNARGKHTIKLITGARHAGKTTLMEAFKNFLAYEGVAEIRIFSYDFENSRTMFPSHNSANAKSAVGMDMGDVNTRLKSGASNPGAWTGSQLLDSTPEQMALSVAEPWHLIYDDIMSQLIREKMNYVFLDEVQNIDDYEQLIVKLFSHDNIDLYVSSSCDFSKEFLKRFEYHYVNINVMPLSYREYFFGLEGHVNELKAYQSYVRDGGFPYIAPISQDRLLTRTQLKNIYDSIMFEDVILKNKIKEPALLNEIVTYLFEHIGEVTSTNRLTTVMAERGMPCSINTVEAYIKSLQRAHMLYRVHRYDVAEKRVLASGVKYYANDTGIRNLTVGEVKGVTTLLENIIFLELKRRGFEVYVGRSANMEVDFVVMGEEKVTPDYGFDSQFGMNFGPDSFGTPQSFSDSSQPRVDKRYIQVALTTRDKGVLKHELDILKTIEDNYPKYLITLDYGSKCFDGIQQISTLDFLLGKISL